MFKERISKERVLEFFKNSRVFRPLANSKDLLIPLQPLWKIGESLALRLRPLNSFKKKIGAFLQTNYLDAKKNKINFLNRILVLTSFFLLFLLVLEFARGTPQPNLLLTKEDQKRETKNVSFRRSKPMSHYSREIGKKELFQLNPGFGTPLALEKSEASNIRLVKLAENLVLLGITIDHEPQAVIENQKDKKTYFLRVGDFIGQIKVEAILRGKVVLGYEDERLELVF